MDWVATDYTSEAPLAKQSYPCRNSLGYSYDSGNFVGQALQPCGQQLTRPRRGAELAEAMKKEPQDVAPPIVVVQLDMDKNEMPKPWGSFMDVPTIVFYPSETPDNPQFLIDRVSPTMVTLPRPVCPVSVAPACVYHPTCAHMHACFTEGGAVGRTLTTLGRIRSGTT